MRGDRPCTKRLRSNVNQFTPHARGSTLAAGPQLYSEDVYPACAGIDRIYLTSLLLLLCLPRMRGDRPFPSRFRIVEDTFTLHARIGP